MLRPAVPWLVAAAAVLQLSPSSVAAATDDLSALAWLSGCWDGEGGGGRNVECWTSAEGGMMLGVSKVISPDETAFEFLRIAPHGGGLAYLASPGGKPAVAFQLVESGDGFAVFANPEHDFPQRLSYRRDGDSLGARIEALRDGEWVGFEVQWTWAGAWWATATETDPAELQAEVRESETAFARSMAERDHQAFVTFLAEDAVFLSSATTRGRDQVAAQWEGFFATAEAPFSWKPETVEVAPSGTLALSTGPVYDPAGRLISRFTSIWRREGHGRWRVVFDKGEPVCAD